MFSGWFDRPWGRSGNKSSPAGESSTSFPAPAMCPNDHGQHVAVGPLSIWCSSRANCASRAKANRMQHLTDQLGQCFEVSFSETFARDMAANGMHGKLKGRRSECKQLCDQMEPRVQRPEQWQLNRKVQELLPGSTLDGASAWMDDASADNPCLWQMHV